MNKTLKWILIGLAAALGVFIIALPLFYLASHAGGLMDLGRDMHPFRTTHPFPVRTWPVLMLPLMGLFGIFRVLLPLAVVGFAVYGIVALVRAKPARSSGTPVQTPPAIPVVPVEKRACVSCGRELTGEGEFCPYCGAKQ